MANEKMVRTICFQENSDNDDCQENIAPEDIDAAGKLKDQVGDVVGYSSTHLSGEDEPLSDTCIILSPPPKSSKGEVNTKSRMFGLQSALTPILNILNIGSKFPFPEPVKHGNGPHLNCPFLTFNQTTANSQKSEEGSVQHPNKTTLGIKDTSVSCLADEYLPEMTLLDMTCDYTMQPTRNDSPLPDTVSSTPLTAKSVNGMHTTRQHMHLSSSCDLNATAQKPWLQNKRLDPLQFDMTKKTTMGIKDTSVSWLADEYLPEITLFDVAQDSMFSVGGELSYMEITQDTLSGDNLKNNSAYVEVCGELMIQPNASTMTQSDEFSSTVSANVTHTLTSLSLQSNKSTGENVMKGSLTQDISMSSVLENCRTSQGAELGEKDFMNSQTSTEDTLGIHAANVTHDISTSSNMSVKSAASQLSSSDMRVNTNSKNVTFVLHGEPTDTSNPVGAKNEDLPVSCDTEMISKEQQHSPETEGSANNTFIIAQSSTNINTTTEMPPHLNKTLDLSPNANSDKADNDTTEQVSSASKNTIETLPRMNQSRSADKAGSSCNVKNTTFEQHSPQKSPDSTELQEAGLQNNSFDSKAFKQYGIINLSETNLSYGQQNSLGKSSSSKVCNKTTSPKENNSEVHPPSSKNNSTSTIGTEPKVKMVDTQEVTFEPNPVVEMGRAEAGHHKSNDQSQSEGLSDILGNQSMDAGNIKANTFNIDDSLDLHMDFLVTSTPMTNCKIFKLCTEQEDGIVLEAQKKLYGNAPTKPVLHVPSNIVCDRKTLLRQPAAKSLLPRLKATSQLLKYKPASVLPGRCEPLSGLPMTRQRTQAKTLKNTAAPDPAQGISGISSSYNLRTTTGSKHPTSGLLRQLMTGIPSGSQTAASSLRLPLARICAPASSSTGKLCGPTATNSVVNSSQPKKHPLTRGGSLKTAKREKMDAAVSASTAETITSCEPASKTRALKHSATSHRTLLPKPQGHGYAKCVALQEQLKRKSEEIERRTAEVQYIRGGKS